MDIKLFIGDMPVDLNDEVQILFNWTETDLSNPTNYRNGYSKTITLEGTNNNNELFGHFWDLERYQLYGGNSRSTFNPSYRVPFVLYHNGSVYERGYVKLEKVIKENEVNKYEISLFGGLGSFLYNLDVDWNTGEKKTLADLDYFRNMTVSFTDLGFIINKETVKQAWDYANTTDVFNKYYHINFAPTYNGIPDSKFDADKVLITLSGSTLTSVSGDCRGYSGYALGKLPDKLTSEQVKDYRSYLQTPVIRVKSVIDAICNPYNNKGKYDNGYTVELDSDFFSDKNPYYSKSWLTLNKINFESYGEVSSSIEFGDLNPVNQYTDSTGKNYVFAINNSGKTGTVTVTAKLRVQIPGATANKLYMSWSRRNFWGSTYYPHYEIVPIQGFTSNSINSNENVYTASKIQWLSQSQAPIQGIDGPYYYSYESLAADGYSLERFINPENTGIENYDAGFTKVSNGVYQYDEDVKFTIDYPSEASYLKIRLSAIYAQKVGAGEPRNVLSTTQHYDSATLYEYRDVLLMNKDFVLNLYDDSGWNSNKEVTQDTLLSTSFSPADFLINYCKQFGLYIYKDLVEDKIYISTRNNFYKKDNVISLDGLIDTSERIDISPLYADTNYVSLTATAIEGESYDDYYDKYGKVYGQKVIDTGYEFNADTKELMDSPLKNAIQTREKGIYYFKKTNGLNPYVYNGFSYNLYKDGDYASGTITIEVPKKEISTYCEPLNSDKYYDIMGKPQFEDASHKSIPTEGVLLFFNGFQDVSGLGYYLTDDSSYMAFLNNNPCWVMTNIETPTAMEISRMPKFSRYYEGNKWMIYSWDYGSPRELYVPDFTNNDEVNLYSLYFKKYLTDLYDINTKVLTCYVKFDNLTEDYLRNIYWFRNGLWRLNKIVDYNPDSTNSTLCEFIKIQDLDDLSNDDPTTDRWIKITLDKYEIGQSGGTIIGTVITSDNYGFTMDGIFYDPDSPLPRGLVNITSPTGSTTTSGNFYLSVPSNIRDAREVTINVTSDYNGQNVSGSTAFNQPGVEYTFDVSPTYLSGGTLSYNKTFNVTNPYYYDWTISSKPAWITVSPSSITNGQYGETGDTAVTVTASKNTTEIERTGTIVLSETTYNHTYNISVKQAGYVFSVSPTTLNYGSASTYQDITVNNPYGYAWSVTSKPDWVTTATTSTGLRITVNKNILTARTGTVVITESDFNHTYSIEVNQESGYVFYIQPTSFSYLCDYELSETLEIVNPNELPWTITNYPAWISVSPSGGTGSASTITAAENIGFERSYSGISVNETTLNRQYLFDVEQESGYYFELLPSTGLSFTSASTSQTMHISCKGYNWQIISKPAWITTNYTTGFGDTNVTVTAAKNIGYERSGSITVKNTDYNLEYTLDVVQESGYVFEVSPTTFAFDGGCDSKTITITNPNELEWEITGLASWITAVPSSGTSGATVTLSVTPNCGNTRIDYFDIDEFTVGNTIECTAIQSGYTFGISPTAFTFDDTVQTKYLNISKPACVAWAISNLPSWLTANPTGGTDARVALTTAENQGFERSKSGITVTDSVSGAEYKFKVTQESGYDFNLLPTTGLSFTSANTSQIMTVSCRDYHWQITSKPAWLEASQMTGYGYTQVYLTPSTNVGYARSGVVKVKDTDYNLEYTLNVEQASGYNFSVSPLSFAFNGGCDSATMTITNPNGLEWKFYQLANWITASPSSGNSSATVTLSVTPNSGTTNRTDSFELEEETVGNTFDCTASQSAYTFSISPTAFTFDDIVQTKYLNIDKPACVAWTITNAPDWITLGASAGTADRVSLTTAKNIGFERSKSGVTVTDTYSNRTYTFNVMQDEGYSFVLLPTTGISFTSANTSQIMTVSCEDYHWEITSKPSWIQASQITGYGYTQVYLTPTTNVGNQRTGTITVRNTDYNLDYTLNLSQAGGYSFSVSPTSFSFDGGGESKTMTITNPNGLEWKIYQLANWISASPISGNSSATVTLTAGANSGSVRTDSFEVEEETVGNTFDCTASQSGYTFSIEPTNLYFDDTVQTKYVNINKPSNISWTISNLPAWLSANPTGGTASRVAITSTENQGYERSQSGITITDSTSGREYKFNARQDEGYSFILLPTTGLSFTSASTSQIMTVSCADYNWQITSKPNWISASQMTGYGYTQVYLTPTQNTGSQRSGTVTVRNTDYNLDYTLSVEQAGGYSFSVSPTTFSFNRTGGTATMTITNPNGMDWSIEQLASWMSASPSTGNSSATVTLTCAANTTTNSRTDYFEVNDDTYGDVIDCTATQDGLLTPSITSITATVEDNPDPPTPTGGTCSITIRNNTNYNIYVAADGYDGDSPSLNVSIRENISANSSITVSGFNTEEVVIDYVAIESQNAPTSGQFVCTDSDSGQQIHCIHSGGYTWGGSGEMPFFRDYDSMDIDFA